MTRLSQSSPQSSLYARSPTKPSHNSSPRRHSSSSTTSPPEGGDANNQAVDLLANLDFTSIEEMDPSLVDGYRVIYDREVSFEVRVQEEIDGPQQAGTLEAFKVKILVLGEDEDPQAVRIELASEADLFFHYIHDMDEHGFALIQEQQKLMVEFVDYRLIGRNYHSLMIGDAANILIKMMNSAINDPATHLAIFVLLPDSSARVDFIQNLEYKYVEILSCNFCKSPEDVIQQHITYRYNSLRGRFALLQARLQDVTQLIKHKSPGLLLQLQKGPTIAINNNIHLTPSYHNKAAAASGTTRATEMF